MTSRFEGAVRRTADQGLGAGGDGVASAAGPLAFSAAGASALSAAGRFPLSAAVALASASSPFPLSAAACLASAAVFAFASTASAQTDPASLQTIPVDPIVEVDWLMERIGSEDLVVVQLERREGEFAEEHIAGSRPILFGDIQWAGDEGWIVEFRSDEETLAALRAAGIRNDSRVVIYGTSMTATARLWVTFDRLGLGDRAFLLSGGIEDWKAAGGAVASGDPEPFAPGDVEARQTVDFRVTADWIHERLDDPSLVLLDARPEDEYTGDDGGLGGTVNPGHIPGAAQLYWEELMHPDNNTRFRSRAEIARILERHGAGAGRTHVAYCMIGMRASLPYIAARMHGLDVHFYDGSWRDWGARDDLPAEVGRDPRDGSG